MITVICSIIILDGRRSFDCVKVREKLKIGNKKPSIAISYKWIVEFDHKTQSTPGKHYQHLYEISINFYHALQKIWIYRFMGLT